MNKWEIKSVEGKPTKFGTGAHITLPKEWLNKTVIVVCREQWEMMTERLQYNSN